MPSFAVSGDASVGLVFAAHVGRTSAQEPAVRVIELDFPLLDEPHGAEAIAAEASAAVVALADQDVLEKRLLDLYAVLAQRVPYNLSNGF
jgi:hypothetical protein